MFHEFDTIKQIKNFPKYGVWYERVRTTLFCKKSTCTIQTIINSLRNNIIIYMHTNYL
jgi:hypothetical protein